MQHSTAMSTRCAADARVVECRPICREHAAIELALAAFPESEPGQFLQLLCRDSREPEPVACDWPADGFPSIAGADFADRQPYLRRPFSIADRWDAAAGDVRMVVISRAVGVGTRWLEHLHPGDTLNITGPLGQGFRIPDRSRPIVLVGGGVGIPPLLYLARRLNDVGWRDVTAVLGATTRDLLPLRLIAEPDRDGTAKSCVELPGGAGYPTIVTSDDGTAGLCGLATDGVRTWYKHRRAATPGALVLACGPEPMLKAVARLTRELHLDCQLCIERNMGCGTGTCLSCIVRRRDPDRPAGWRWALACTDGPVFARDELLDYADDPRA